MVRLEMKLTKKDKKEIWLVFSGLTSLFSILFMGVSLTLMIQTSKTDIILMTLYAIVTIGLLMLFHTFFSQLPFKKVA